MGMIFIQTEEGLLNISEKITKDVIEEALGYVPADDNINFTEITNNPIGVSDDGEFNIVDDNGYIGFKLNEDGAYAKEFISGENKLSEKINTTDAEKLVSDTVNQLNSTVTANTNILSVTIDEEAGKLTNVSVDDSKLTFNNIPENPIIDKYSDSTFSVIDKYGYLGLKLDSNGLIVKDVIAGNDILSNKADKTYVDEKLSDVSFNIDLIYPIGSIYMSVNSTNPSILFGGEWEQIEDRFLLGAGNSYLAGSTGGEAKVTLTSSQVPNVIGDITLHSGGTATNISSVSGCFSANITNTNSYRNGGDTIGNSADSIGVIHFDNGGKSGSHNNMPPYLTVYMWKRIS